MLMEYKFSETNLVIKKSLKYNDLEDEPWHNINIDSLLCGNCG